MAQRAHGSEGQGWERVVRMFWGEDFKDLQDFEFFCL